MRILEEIMLDGLIKWDRNYPSDLAIPMLAELAADGRFDEITLLMQQFKKQFGLAFSSVEGKIAAIILNHYIYPVMLVDESVIMERWNAEGLASMITKAAMREGLLDMTVDRVVQRLLQKKTA